jgi:hypothetical protein
MEIRTVLGIVAVVVYIAVTLLAIIVFDDRSLAAWVALGGLLTWPVAGALLSR